MNDIAMCRLHAIEKAAVAAAIQSLQLKAHFVIISRLPYKFFWS